jgi:hypothetical protein
VWQDQGKWAEFKMYLANLSEGEDSEGVPIMLDRLDYMKRFYGTPITPKTNMPIRDHA